MNRYGDRDVVALGDYYTQHVSAMTIEGLHSKSDIAAELAHRDLRIHDLEDKLTAAANRSDAYHAQAISAESKLEAVSAELAATEAHDTKGTEVIVDLTLRQDRLVEVLKVTASNIRSLGPAGQLHEPYRPWLKTVEDAIEESTK